eukprot:CAMPEP_0171353626 /NCGR_PEP_ID=MMETSP0878-20121228/44290_1 /TAXON_ID=67004 /ORGANISM="Thalassiosira weissflogii, Strain CCMP1336" /LENGTH=274 /DNA_ID=CAMNT_0011859577 /DNA_START=108 /DNA_END=930 /DNA_ORIENTATION=-
MNEFATNVWVVEGSEPVQWYGHPYTIRMVVIRLIDHPNEDKPCAWIWSPIPITDALAQEVESKAGPVKYICSPNKIHHIFLKEWSDKFPDAIVYASPGLEKREVAKGVKFDARFGKDEPEPPFANEIESVIVCGSYVMEEVDREVAKGVKFDARFGKDEPEPPFANEIESVIVCGSYVMEEVEFFHKASKTAIICDLIQRFPEPTGIMLKLGGVVGENGSTPRDWRITFWPFGKGELRKSRDAILGWKAEKLIIAHGTCVESNASDVIEKALYW